MGSNCIELTTHSAEATQAIGMLLGRHARAGDVYLLMGALGTGKTCFAQGILWGLGSQEYARSPTFVLMAQYEGRLTMYHMDLYRIERAEEIHDLGLEEYLFGDGVCAVEWPEKATATFPSDALTIRFDALGETTRRLTLTGDSDRFAGTLNG